MCFSLLNLVCVTFTCNKNNGLHFLTINYCRNVYFIIYFHSSSY